MIPPFRPALTGAALLAVTGSLYLTGCTSTVAGIALPAPDPATAGSPVSAPAGGSAPEPTAEPAAESTVAADKLPGLLLSPGDVGPLVGAAGLTVTDTFGAVYPPPPGGTVSDPQCVGAAYVGQAPVYQGTGYVGLAGQRITEPDNSRNHIVDQVLTSFHDSAAAQKFVTAQGQSWQQCSGRSISRHFDDGTDDRWTVGQAAVTGTGVTVLNLVEGGNGWGCSHALAVKANVVAEVLVCGPNITDQGVAVRDRVLTKVSA
jgi:hypothetical protein